jgi:hypothetical protein
MLNGSLSQSVPSKHTNVSRGTGTPEFSLRTQSSSFGITKMSTIKR